MKSYFNTNSVKPGSLYKHKRTGEYVMVIEVTKDYQYRNRVKTFWLKSRKEHVHYENYLDMILDLISE